VRRQDNLSDLAELRLVNCNSDLQSLCTFEPFEILGSPAPGVGVRIRTSEYETEQDPRRARQLVTDNPYEISPWAVREQWHQSCQSHSI